MSKLLFTPLAEADLQAILGYIACDRPDTALRIVAEIGNKCEFLAKNPLAGERRPEISPVHRCSVYKRWVIYYRALEHSVEVHRVLDGAQDLGGIF
jgi:toxin ParE1/3/4